MTMPVHCPASALLFSVSIQVIYQLIRRKHTIENERKCKKKKKMAVTKSTPKPSVTQP